jgi:hypothetical protein
VFDANKFVTLLNKIYLTKGEKYKLEFSFKVIDTFVNQQNNLIEAWTNPIFYDVLFGNQIIFSNRGTDVNDNEQLIFDNSKEVTLKFEYIAPSNGLLDLKLYEPFSIFEELVAVELNRAEISPIAFEDLEVYEDEIDDEFTVIKEKDLTFFDDPSGFSSSFRLSRLNENFATPYATVDVSIVNSFTELGRHYSVVNLQGAALIDANRNLVTHVSTPNLEVLEVFYNYLSGESMVVETNTANLTGVISVELFRKVEPPADRSTWKEWTDSLYRVERLSFLEAVGKIYRRMFKVPHVQIDATARFPVLFNDMLRFNFQGAKNFIVTNIKGWNIDGGKTSLSISRALYQEDGVETPGNNIPPFVDAGPDVLIEENQTLVNLSAQATDPDGFIANQLWTQDTAEVATILSPNTLATGVANFSADFATFRITVTDNDGATAFDTVNVIRFKDYTLAWVLDTEDSLVSAEEEMYDRSYNLVITPALVEGVNLVLRGFYKIRLNPETAQDQALAILELTKNGALIIDEEYTDSDVNLSEGALILTVPYTFSINSTDDISIRIKVEAVRDLETSASATVDFVIEEIEVITGFANITTNLPLTLTETANV